MNPSTRAVKGDKVFMAKLILHYIPEVAQKISSALLAVHIKTE